MFLPERLRLAPLDLRLVESLLGVAVADAAPEEVMPPVAGPPGWTPARREAFRAFYRARLAGFAGPDRTVMYAVTVDGQVVGMIRLAVRGGEDGDPAVLETGIWLARTWRGRGVGAAALRAVLAEAWSHGARAVVADSTTANPAALAVLRTCGAVLTTTGTTVYAEIRLGSRAYGGSSAPSSTAGKSKES